MLDLKIFAGTIAARIRSAEESRRLAREHGDKEQTARMNGYIDALTEVALDINAARFE